MALLKMTAISVFWWFWIRIKSKEYRFSNIKWRENAK